MEPSATFLRRIAERLGQPPLSKLIGQPLLREAIRVTVLYGAPNIAAVIATVMHIRGSAPELSVVYQGHFDQRPVRRMLTEQSFEELSVGLRALKFDQLKDEPDLMPSSNLWLVERGAGGYTKSLILSPQTTRPDYQKIIGHINQLIPEVSRQLPLRG